MTGREPGNFIDVLADAGRADPHFVRERRVRNQALLSAGIVQGFDLTDEGLVPRLDRAEHSGFPWRRMALSLAIAVAMLAAASVCSFSVTNCMPGHPLYSTRRLVEKARIVLRVVPDTRAHEHLRQTDDRLGELSYARTRGMRSWYWPLASDASDRLESATMELISTAPVVSPVTEDGGKPDLLIAARDALFELEAVLKEMSADLEQTHKDSMREKLDTAASLLEKIGSAGASGQ